MNFHILNGDALTDRFLETGLEGNVVITREAMISGDLSGETRSDFYRNRAKSLIGPGAKALQDYYAYSVSEFDKLAAAKSGDHFYLWFGYDLFCRMNMLFMLSLIQSLAIEKKIYAVYPSYLKENELWADFGNATPGLLHESYQNKIEINAESLEHAQQLWNAFRSEDLSEINALSLIENSAFPHLDLVCKAHLERFSVDSEPGRPEKRIRELIRSGKKDFQSLFRSFNEQEGIYGFGDLQVKEIYDRLIVDLDK